MSRHCADVPTLESALDCIDLHKSRIFNMHVCMCDFGSPLLDSKFMFESNICKSISSIVIGITECCHFQFSAKRQVSEPEKVSIRQLAKNPAKKIPKEPVESE